MTSPPWVYPEDDYREVVLDCGCYVEWRGWSVYCVGQPALPGCPVHEDAAAVLAAVEVTDD